MSQLSAQLLTSMCGVCISPRSSGDNTPLKIYQILESGVPLVATKILSHTQVLNDESCVLSGTSSTELADALLFAVRNPDRMKQLGRQAQAWYEKYYSRDIYTEKMRLLMADVS